MRSRPISIFAAVYLAYVTYGLDRTVISIAMEQLRHELALSDVQVGLLSGLAYGVPFAIAGVLVGPLIDRRNRMRLMAAMLAAWSLATVLCGLAVGFLTLLMARLAVGAAEAGGTPASLAILSDTFRPDRRATIIGLYKTALPIGIFVSTIVCGYVADVYGWRHAFIVAGIPGILLAGFLMLLRDPPRGGADAAAAGRPLQEVERFSITQVADYVWRTPGITPLILGIVVFSFANGGPGVFAIAFLQRSHGLSVGDASLIYGIGAGMGSLSPIILGLAGDRLSRIGAAPNMYLSVGVCFAAAAFGLLMASSGSALLAGVSLVAWQMLGMGLTAPNYAILLTLTPAGMRGTVMSVVLIGISLIGMGLGPTAVGAVSQLFGGDGEGLRSSIIVILLLNLVAAGCFGFAARRMSRPGDAQPATMRA